MTHQATKDDGAFHTLARLFHILSDQADAAAKHMAKHHPEMASQYRMQRDTWAQSSALAMEMRNEIIKLTPEEIDDAERAEIIAISGTQARLIGRLLYAISVTSAFEPKSASELIRS